MPSTARQLRQPPTIEAIGRVPYFADVMGILMVSCSRSLAINLALYGSFYSAFIKVSSTRNRVLLVYRPTILKGSLLYRRPGLYIDWSIYNY